MNKVFIAQLSILANILLASGKITVGLFSKSSAILAAGIDSFIDIFSSLISYLSIKLGQKPADEKHPYGHYKFEVLGGVIITLIIFISGMGIIYNAINKIFNPEIVSIGYISIGIMVISIILNEIMSRIKIHFGKKENSYSLISDGMHSRLDVYTSIIILLGLFFTPYWIYTDSFLAILMGIYILKSSFSIGKEAVDSLLDASAGPEIDKQIEKIANNQNIEINSIKTQKKGSAITANLEIKLAKNLNVGQATKLSEELRKALINSISNLEYVAIQILSHQLQTGYYKPNMGKGMGWQKREQFLEKTKSTEGKGPKGACICEKCGYTIRHQRGTPCSKNNCPNCNIALKRK